MLIRRAVDIQPSEITSESIYWRRREVVRALGLGIPALLMGCSGEQSDAVEQKASSSIMTGGKSIVIDHKGEFTTTETLTSYKDITTYNNYYEFGTGKADPARTSEKFKPDPWSVEIAGHAEITGKFSLENILKDQPLEEHIYRMRCVEGWSMVIPWVGFPLANLIKRFKPTANAKYVAFTTVNRPEQMPGMAYASLNWPYREGLRIDEATHPLALLAVGLYGKTLPNQNGAPLRLVVPWKYGFKGIKSIVKIEFVETQPRTSWNETASGEYGFYSNVNPDVDHPRWSQKTERRISGEGLNLFGNRIPTQKFNGYAEQVASLYAGMDLKKFY